MGESQASSVSSDPSMLAIGEPQASRPIFRKACQRMSRNEQPQLLCRETLPPKLGRHLVSQDCESWGIPGHL